MATKTAAKAAVKKVEPTPVVVVAPSENVPTAQGAAAAEFMNKFEEQRAEESNSFADRLTASGLGYWDDNVANKRYIAKLDSSELHTVLGTPMGQIRRLLWPDTSLPNALQGILVLKDDGSFYSIPAGVASLAEVVDPDGKPLVPAAKAKAKK